MSGERKIRGCTPMQLRFCDESIALEFEVIPSGRTSHFLAAQRAGYQGNDETLYSTGSRLSRNAAVIVEITRRRLAARRAVGMDESFLISGFLELYELAKDDGKYGQSRACLMDAARIGGFVVDKSEVKTWDVGKVLEGVSPDQLRAMASVVEGEALELGPGE